MAAQREQVLIAGNDGIDSGSQGAGEHLVVVRIARDRFTEPGRFDGVAQGRVIFQQYSGRQLGLPDALGEFVTSQEFGQFGEQRRAGDQGNLASPGGVDQSAWWALSEQAGKGSVGVNDNPHHWRCAVRRAPP